MKHLTTVVAASDLKNYGDYLKKEGPRIQELSHKAACIELRDYDGWMALDAKTAWKILALLPRER